MAVTLPPRLSDQQRYILARLAALRDHDEGGRGRHRTQWLSRDVALEFDEDGDRLQEDSGMEPTTTPDEIIDDSEDRLETLLEAADDQDQVPVADLVERETILAKWQIQRQRRLSDEPLTRRHTVTSSHSSSVSRALDSLEDRGLISACWPAFRDEPRGYRRWVCLTDERIEVGEELLRRHRDGRYSLAFDTVEGGRRPPE